MSATTSVPLFIAPVRCRIVYAAIAAWSAGVTADDVNYWSITVSRYRNAAAVTIGTKTTQVTGGQAVTQRVPWVFDASAFDPASVVLEANDVAAFIYNKVAAAVTFPSPLMTIQYVPV